ncbi:hypothetical protein DH2020_024291 [Rehmannia glutinosa]|uniref:Uncharacterized protein n=1 Tax=Rehmannia glutinosa TaxID=99300 RepID=A0ABR0WAR4_REHGL
MGTLHRSGVIKKSNDSVRLILTTIIGMVLGYFIGVSFPSVSLSKINLSSSLISSFDMAFNDDHHTSASRSFPENLGSGSTPLTPKIYAPTNPRGAESLPPGIVVSESDFYLRRLWGEPSEVSLTSYGYMNYDEIYAYDHILELSGSEKEAEFSEDFQIMLFHYDGGQVNGTNLSGHSVPFMWYAKRFLHPDVVAAYDYIFIWDEDLGVEHFNAENNLQKPLPLEHEQPTSPPTIKSGRKSPHMNRTMVEMKEEEKGEERGSPSCIGRLVTGGQRPPEKWGGVTVEERERRYSKARSRYMELVKKHGLEISQPGLEPNNGLTWQMTKRRGDREVHNFVEIMAPVFSREAWKCVWHMIQNDLVHGWGLDFALRRCVDPAHEKIGVVDSQWIVHQVIPSLGSQGEAENGKAPWQGVRDRCKNEWALFQDRLANADKAYFSQLQHP